MANALHQPDIAKTMLGQTAIYARLPYFFTDKHNLDIKYTGYTAPQADHDLVIRGDLATREFIALWLVNIWEMNEQIRN